MARLFLLIGSLAILCSCERSAPPQAPPGTANTPPVEADPSSSPGVVPEGPSSKPGLIRFPEDNRFLPADWIAEPISAATTPVEIASREKARGIIEEALAKYPAPVLERFLSGVYLVGSLDFYNVSYGGTYMANARRVVLVYKPSFNERGFEQRFHHEFSSLLLKKNESRFEESRWLSANEPTFVYRAPGIIEEQSGEKSEATRVLEAEQKRTGGSGSSLLRIEAELMEKGFLTAYNQVSLEQDLNETAAHLFTNPDIWDYCRQYPRVDQKIDVLIDFYRELDSSFDRLYFRQLNAPVSGAGLPGGGLPGGGPPESNPAIGAAGAGAGN